MFSRALYAATHWLNLSESFSPQVYRIRDQSITVIITPLRFAHFPLSRALLIDDFPPKCKLAFSDNKAQTHLMVCARRNTPTKVEVLDLKPPLEWAHELWKVMLH